MTLAYSVRFSRCSPGGGVYGVARPVELALEPRDHRLVGRRLGPAHAGRRHHAGAQLPDDPLPLFAVVFDVRGVEVVDRELASGVGVGAACRLSSSRYGR